MRHILTTIAALHVIALLAGCGKGTAVRPAEPDPGNALSYTAGGCEERQGRSLRDDMLCAHNRLRASPPASQPDPEPPLPPLKWNEKLANLARAHAERCVYEHSERAIRTAPFDQWVGENLAVGTAGAYADRTIVRRWAEEAANYDYRTNRCAPGKVCGHYTQILWRDTTEVGCAKVTCDSVANQPNMGRADLWVCNYLPGGNIVGERPY